MRRWGPFNTQCTTKTLQIISYESARGGITVITRKEDSTTSNILIQNARPSDSGRYQCEPSNGESKSVLVHVLNGKHIQWFYSFIYYIFLQLLLVVSFSFGNFLVGDLLLFWARFRSQINHRNYVSRRRFRDARLFLPAPFLMLSSRCFVLVSYLCSIGRLLTRSVPHTPSGWKKMDHLLPIYYYLNFAFQFQYSPFFWHRPLDSHRGIAIDVAARACLRVLSDDLLSLRD